MCALPLPCAGESIGSTTRSTTTMPLRIAAYGSFPYFVESTGLWYRCILVGSDWGLSVKITNRRDGTVCDANLYGAWTQCGSVLPQLNTVHAADVLITNDDSSGSGKGLQCDALGDGYEQTAYRYQTVTIPPARTCTADVVTTVNLGEMRNAMRKTIVSNISANASITLAPSTMFNGKGALKMSGLDRIQYDLNAVGGEGLWWPAFYSVKGGSAVDILIAAVPESQRPGIYSGTLTARISCD